MTLKLTLAVLLGLALGLAWGSFVDRDMDRAMADAGVTVWNVSRASWYGPGFHGRRTANGERFDQMAMTAAHKRLKFNTMIEVCRHDRPEVCVVVRINDRGPYKKGREIDLSKGAMLKLDGIREGVIRVRWREVPRPDQGGKP